MKEILFAKLKESAVIPSKREEDGAFDVYPCFEEDYIALKPHETKMIPTGLCSVFSDKYVALLKERGSTGTKGIAQRAGVIDSGYRGEWHIPITNTTDKLLLIIKAEALKNMMPTMGTVVYPYEKALAQCVMVEVPKLAVREVTVEEVLSYSSERGTGKLGSSGK